MNLKFFRRNDLILLAVLLIICAVTLLPKYLSKPDTALTAVVMVNGEVKERIVLSDVTSAYEYTVPCDSPVKLYISSDGVSFIYSECPDKICINTGKLTRAGDTAACVPNKVLVMLEGEKAEGDPDIVTY